MDYLKSLESDYHRLIEIGGAHLGNRVPTCPEWTVDDLLRHVAMVYLHKVECMRHNEMPKEWPPDPTGETAVELLRRGYTELAAEFAVRSADTPAATWYEPDQTVGFWLRRMAQETVIHRIDAELAAGVPSLTAPDDLAQDGIDEVLRICLAWASEQWHEEFADELSKGDGRIDITAGGRDWQVSWDSAGVHISDGGSRRNLAGSADQVLRWLWRRAGNEAVTIDIGDSREVSQLRALVDAATQ